MDQAPRLEVREEKATEGHVLTTLIRTSRLLLGCLPPQKDEWASESRKSRERYYVSLSIEEEPFMNSMKGFSLSGIGPCHAILG